MGYHLLDIGNGKRLEEWGQYRLVRPEAEALEEPVLPTEEWSRADAVFEGEKGKGQWVTPTPLPESWPIDYGNVKLSVKLAPYKHTGVFPEQILHWDWMRDVGKKAGRPLKVLNLFAYTGAASVVLAKEGHFVTHVDASKPAIAWAKENAVLNEIPGDGIRWMVDDAAEFAARELKRQNSYDAILLDPPAFGHSPSGKMWRVERDLKPLLEICAKLLSDTPAFIVVNGYAKNQTAHSLGRLLEGILHTRFPGKPIRINSAELFLHAETGKDLTTGIYARWSALS